MDNKDVEMEDAEKCDSGNEIKETDDKVSDVNIELKKDEPPYAVTVAEDANKSENGDGSSNKLSSLSEMESQTNCVGETHEPVSVEGVEQTGEKIDTESKNEGGISIGADAEVQAAAESIVDEITGLKNGVVNESDANDALKEEDPVGNDDESEIPVNNVEGNSSCSGKAYREYGD
ncbi:uncharacterized protein LOC121766945 [Salvia splendens]|uniref:uncharacterized protein LOC121766945 n=1 Tax=Salvia splendens TaxID=180675 RepID=UPI001C273CFE|nr:uncharacterized protein LOC121766945 [Salvia splendens]XP_042019109.1 uncharacterized protein LOC121766945 [Salvia splendens]XP_042019112.1 uncharacterized protein LOC121766945 [Salvia splendens]